MKKNYLCNSVATDYFGRTEQNQNNQLGLQLYGSTSEPLTGGYQLSHSTSEVDMYQR